jgi:hypothetical protein
MHWTLICIEFRYDMTDNLERLLWLFFFYRFVYDPYTVNFMEPYPIFMLKYVKPKLKFKKIVIITLYF